MSNAGTPIPEITDEDIEWVRELMALDPFDTPRREFLKCRTTIDLSACPGSGKTTLVVAKLAILAKKWPYRNKGICVLSHTNVAREQIEQRLGNSVVGQRLLSYPHFVDTIHGFVNRFLALPWLYSNGYPSPIIDDVVCTGHRRRVLAPREYWLVQNFLKKKHSDFDKLRIRARDLSFDLGSKAFPSQPSTKSYQHAKRAIEATAHAGYFCFDEMFVWAKALLQDFDQLPVWLAHRFPLVILDEMQDTFERQATFLSIVFPNQSDKLVVQRVGDPNQAIFDAPNGKSAKIDPFPDPDKLIQIPNSYRFGEEIAAFASPFAVHPVGPAGLTGIGPKTASVPAQKDGHAILVFPDDTTEGVLDAYGNHVLAVLGAELAGKGLVTAVGHVHQDDSSVSQGDKQYPKSVGHYWDGYSAELSRKDSNPHTLAQYARAAKGLISNGNVFSPSVEKIASGILLLADLIGDIGELKKRKRTHRAIVEKLESVKDVRENYANIVRLLLTDQITLSKEYWPALSEKMKTVAAALCEGGVDTSKADHFLEWPRDDSSLQSDESSTATSNPNIYRVQGENGMVDVQLGSIHSVKGQTHVATLLLNTYWHNHSVLQMMPWLTGKRTNMSNAATRDSQRLLHTYVAMTRPSHLVCVAAPHKALGGDQATQETTAMTLLERGWSVGYIANGVLQWLE